MRNDPTGGWNASAEAWIRFVDAGDPNRTHLLDPVMLKLCGEVKDLRVLDVGCGEGRFCRMLAQRGAQVTGLEPTSRLLEEARKRHPEGRYEPGDAAKLPYGDSSFDLVVSYVALVDIADYRTAIREKSRVLKPGGRVVLANLQPFATTSPTGWHRDKKGKKMHFPVDRYPDEYHNIARWKGIEIRQYHRPMGHIMRAFFDAGFNLREFLEPVPTAETVKANPGMADEIRVPIFVVMDWRKP